VVNFMGAWTILKDSAKKIPVNSWAIGVVGLSAALWLILSQFKDAKIPLVGIPILICLMLLLFLAHRFTKLSSPSVRHFLQALGWIVIATFGLFMLVLVTSFAFGWPEHASQLLFSRTQSSSEDVIYSLNIVRKPPAPFYFDISLRNKSNTNIVARSVLLKFRRHWELTPVAIPAAYHEISHAYKTEIDFSSKPQSFEHLIPIAQTIKPNEADRFIAQVTVHNKDIIAIADIAIVFDDNRIQSKLNQTFFIRHGDMDPYYEPSNVIQEILAQPNIPPDLRAEIGNLTFTTQKKLEIAMVQLKPTFSPPSERIQKETIKRLIDLKSKYPSLNIRLFGNTNSAQRVKVIHELSAILHTANFSGAGDGVLLDASVTKDIKLTYARQNKSRLEEIVRALSPYIETTSIDYQEIESLGADVKLFIAGDPLFDSKEGYVRFKDD
jgi:hypothetical protein